MQLDAPKSRELGWGKLVQRGEGEQHTSGFYLLISEPSGAFGAHISGFFSAVTKTAFQRKPQLSKTPQVDGN